MKEIEIIFKCWSHNFALEKLSQIFTLQISLSIHLYARYVRWYLRKRDQHGEETSRGSPIARKNVVKASKKRSEQEDGSN